MPKNKSAGATRLPEYTNARQLPKHAWPALGQALRDGRRLRLDRDSWFVDAETGKPIAPHPEIERELPRDFFERADLYQGTKLVRRGRPALAEADRKEAVSLRLDRAVLAHFRKAGRGWQTRINDTLRRAAKIK